MELSQIKTEKVKLDSGFKLKANPKATTGKQYIAHAVKPQWKRGYDLEYSNICSSFRPELILSIL